MINKIAIVLFFVFLTGCKNDTTTSNITKELVAFSPEVEENAVIYKVNINQYSPEGTFNAFTKDIPQLKELGVKIIWVMPIFPISQTKRNVTSEKDGEFVSEIPVVEQQKKLGNDCAVSDFKKVNSEFGTIEDFRNLVKTAHNNGIYVVLDWLPSHTSWDHVWIKQHPEYYSQNLNREIINSNNTKERESFEGKNLADLNYENKELRDKMIAEMLYWIKNEAIDGFHCNSASDVPLDFWKQAVPLLRKGKNIFMMSDNNDPAFLKDGLFDMTYEWESYDIINKIAQGKETVSSWDAFMEKSMKKYEPNAIVMNFVDNHNGNSWNGSVKKRLGTAEEALTALTYVAPGMPLIYSGDEKGFDRSLKLYKNNLIPKEKPTAWELRMKLGKLKSENIALNGGKNKAIYKRIKTSNENVLVFERIKNGKSVMYIGNLSSQPSEFKIPVSGFFFDCISARDMGLNEKQTYSMAPWQYFVLTKK